jgi:hypothetical protein
MTTISRGILISGAGLLALAPAALSAKPSDNTLTLTAKPKTVTFTKATALTGVLAGPDAAGSSVTLEADTTAPLGDKFAATGDKTTTAADGTYAFSVKPSVITQYRVVAKTSPNTTSDPIQVGVRPKVTLRLSDRTPKAGTSVTFSGAVLPAHDGAPARVERRTKSG